MVAGYLAGAALLIIASQVWATGLAVSQFGRSQARTPAADVGRSTCSLLPRPARCRQLAQARGRIAHPPAPPTRLECCCPNAQIKFILGLHTEHASTIQDIIVQVDQNIDDFNW